MAVVECPFTSEFVGIVPSINPDFSFIHAQAADLQGNIYIQGALGADVVGLKAGDIKIVSVEEILDGPQAKKKYGDPMIFSFMVDYIVESSHGAYPTIVPKLYDGDLGYMELFSEYWRNEQGFQLFSNEWILDSEEKLFSHLGKDRLSSLRHS
jgi:glutaconate CoA-transferase subunit A